MLISADKLTQTSIAILTGIGSSRDEAQIVADHMREANLKGHDSHGIGMLVQYVKQAAEGGLVPNTPARLINDAGVILQFSGDRGFGQRIGREATDAAIERTRENGLTLMTIANTAHLGRIGTYGEQATAAGLISISFVNVNSYAPIVAPFGGSQPRMGTNPVCIAMPGYSPDEPFILDFATSVVAHGKARVAYLAGTHFDEDVVVTPEGVRTSDPTSIFEGDPRGALIAFAKHKGSGLALAAELLAGLLSSGGTLQPGNPREGFIVNNMTSILIDPARLGSTEWMHHEYQAMIDYLRSSHQADSVNNPVLIAGEPERARRERRLREGVAISDGEWQAIRDAGTRVGVDVDAL
ncbi:MAG TPA: malate/lactate/ureidoglycolate dehydrogenase [Pseudoclavibacter sp.]|nr:malate/lactate/ureidoglycolate dehydrogenase [Pseudoclavibacter sp.]